MPRIIHMEEINICPEKFLDACSPTELNELDMLLAKPQYQDKMRGYTEEVPAEQEADEAWRKLALMRINYKDNG